MQNQHQWINRSQPQALQRANVLLYLNAALTILLGTYSGTTFGYLLYLCTVLGAVGGYGIANERKWGYQLAVACALIPFAIYTFAIVRYGFGRIGNFSTIVALTFQIALTILLLHETSKKYQKIWFK